MVFGPVPVPYNFTKPENWQAKFYNAICIWPKQFTLARIRRGFGETIWHFQHCCLPTISELTARLEPRLSPARFQVYCLQCRCIYRDSLSSTARTSFSQEVFDTRAEMWHNALQQRFSAIPVTISGSPFGWPKT
jgi:hypothetical protein